MCVCVCKPDFSKDSFEVDFWLHVLVTLLGLPFTWIGAYGTDA